MHGRSHKHRHFWSIENRITLRLDSLESRIVPYSSITTPYYNIPNFGDNPTVSALSSGAWSNPLTWSTGQVPTAGSVVLIGTGDVVTYDIVSDAAVKTVAVQKGGSLKFRTDVSTRLTVDNLLVMEGGELQIGSAATPVAASVKAEVIFADVPLDSVNDPLKYGHGLIGLGKVTMHGAVQSATFVNLAFEPLAGTTTLTLTQPVTGWKAGDRLVLPDTRQIQDGTPQHERPTLASVSANGLTLTLTQPLQFNHKGAYDGANTLRFLPHVGNLTHNVIVRSQNATGNRGHTFFTQRADVDIRYAQFSGLGRTTNDMPDNTTLDANGTVTHVGTNQMGRYPIHFANLVGPAITPASGYQFTFVGNSVFCPLDPMPFRWGINISASDYGLVKDNVLYNWAGAGIITEDGSESYNVIEHNFVVRVTSAGGRADTRLFQDIGFEGSGYWFRGPNNYVRGNVTANSSWGYTGFQEYVGTRRVPAFPGADRSVAGQYTEVNMNAQSLREFSNNEAYSIGEGLTFWWLGTWYNTPITSTPESLIQNFHVWHSTLHGYYGYQTHHVTFDGFVAIGDKTIVANTGDSPMGMWCSDYLTSDFLMRNADIEGFGVGILTSPFGQGTFTVKDSYLKNVSNVVVDSIGAPGSNPYSDSLPEKTTIIRNVTFQHVPSSPYGGQPYDIYMWFDGHQGFQNLVVPDRVFVYDFNQISGDNFQVYYNEQAPGFVMPQTVGNSLIGSPVAGLTNQQNWNQFGIAIAGAVAPTNQTRAGIWGFVSPIGNPFGGTLVGHVNRDTNKNGVIDANEVGEPNLVVYIDLNANQVRDASEPTATTDVNGNYSLVVNTDGKYAARLDLSAAPQFVQTTANPIAQNVSGGATVTVSPAFGVALITTGGSLVGQVYRDTNKNGVLDAGEIGEPNISVYVDLNNNKVRDAGETLATTNANGNYSLVVAANGTYSARIDLTAAPTLFQTTANPAAQAVSGGATVTVSPAFGVALNPVGGVLVGQVYRDTNKNGVLDTGEIGEPNITVYVDLNNNKARDTGEPLATTDAKGNYSLAVATNGTYTARIDLAAVPSFFQSSANPAAQAVSGGGTVSVSPAFGVALNPVGGFLVGQVYRDKNKNGILDAAEIGEPNIPVYVDLNNNKVRDAGEPMFTTDAKGNYSLPVAANGLYFARIDLSALDYYSQTSLNPPAVNVTWGATITPSPAFGVYRRGGTVAGVVFFDANRNGLRDLSESSEAGVTVFIDSNNDGLRNAGEISTVTSASGAFGMSVTTDGSYTVRQIPRNGQFASTSNPMQAAIAGDNTVTMDFGTATAFVVGSGAGTGAKVQVYNPDGSLRTTISPYGQFAGGVRVATGDIDGDGVPDIITAPGAGGGPHVRVYSGTTFQLMREYYAFSANMTFGVFVSTGDVDGDGHLDIIAGTGVGLGVHNEPRVRVFSGVNNALLRDFIAFPDISGKSTFNSFNVGATVASADFNSDGNADIVVGPESGNPNVIVYSGADNTPAPTRLRDYFAYAPVTPGGSQFYPLGAYVAAGDYDGDGAPDIITGAGINVATGVGGGSHVRVFSGGNKSSIALEFFAYPNLATEFRGGVRVGAVDIDGDGRIDILAAPGKSDQNPAGITNKVRVYTRSQSPIMNLAPFDNFLGGAYVG